MHFNFQPDIKTFTLMLEVIPSNADTERDLINALHAHQVSPDVDFFNALIRKRNLRGDFHGAKVRKIIPLIMFRFQ